MAAEISSDGQTQLRRSMTKRTLNGTTYCEAYGFSPGILPTLKDVIQSMLYLLRPERAGKIRRTVNESCRLLAHSLIKHWEHCHVYTINIMPVQKKINHAYHSFQNNVNTRKPRQTKEWKVKMDTYNQEADKLFDIFCSDEKRRTKLGEDHGFNMKKEDFEFYEDMKTLRQMYYEDFTENAWMSQMDAYTIKEHRYAKLKLNQIKEEERVSSVSWDNIILEGDDEENEAVYINNTSSSEEMQTESEVDSSTVGLINAKNSQISLIKRKSVKRRKMVSASSSQEKDLFPQEYRHVRINVNVVKPAFYQTVDKIKAELHCSSKQASGAIILTANGMFGRAWKSHNQDNTLIDLDTAPHVRNARDAGQALTALCLSEIVDEIIEAGGCVITYHEDGSKAQGVGGYSVQGITINKKFRPLPALPVASECRTNLAALKIAILSILAVCNDKYSPSQIFNAITFKITDATSHNFEVDDIVAAELGTTHIPAHLLCHTHPVLMFNRKIVEVCTKIEKEIGPDKIYSSFLVNATTSHDSVLEQYIDCLVGLVSSDYNHKSWNKSKEFDIFIGKEKNKAKALKKERFNRFVYLSAVVLHHQHQVQEFLNKYETITNTLACIVRAFED